MHSIWRKEERYTKEEFSDILGVKPETLLKYYVLKKDLPKRTYYSKEKWVILKEDFNLWKMQLRKE